MEPEYMKIFQKFEDHGDWDKQCAFCDIIEELTDFEKQMAKRAFQFLRQEFGNDFLIKALSEKHPICWNLVNMAPWTRRWITWFADALKELKKAQNYSSLLERLKNKDKFHEGHSVLEAGYKFSKIDFSVAIDPPVDISGNTKVPDLKIVNGDTKEDLFVEISIVGESMVQKEASQAMDKIIMEPLWRGVPFMHFCGRLHKVLAKRHLEDIAKKVEGLVKEAKKDNSFHDLIIEDVIELGIAPESDKEILEKWASGRGFKVGEFSGPPYNVDEIARAKSRIDAEQKQLPNNCPNLLLIRHSNLFWYARDIRRAISELEESVYKYPHLLAVVIDGKYTGSGESDLFMKDQHVFIKKTRADFVTEQYILLWNKYCDIKVTPATTSKFYNAFINY